ncbi:MAG: response regulator transcription factor [Micrococcales bacterium]
MTHKILVIEDEQDMLDMVVTVLTAAGHTVETCTTGDDAMDIFRENNPDVVVLDWQLPGKDGLEILQEIVAESQVPVIMASAKTNVEDVDRALDLGAADYIKKAYGGKELLSKIKSVLNRPERTDNTFVRVGPIEIDVSAYEVRRNGVKILLTPLEFNLLLTIAEDPKHTFTREELLKKVWLHKNLNEQADFKGKIDTRLVNVHIQRLRSKIEENPDDPKIVATVRGRGYKAGQE